MNSANPSAEPVAQPVAETGSSRGDGSPALNSAPPKPGMAPDRGARGLGVGMAPAAGADVSEDARVKRLRIRSAASKRAAASVKRMRMSRETEISGNFRSNAKI